MMTKTMKTIKWRGDSNMECYSFSKAGRFHLKNGEKNQDQIFGIRSSDRIAVCLSDGCSTSPRGLAAAQKVVTLTAKMFFNDFYDLLLDDSDTVRRKVSAVLQPTLRAFAAQQGVRPETLAATLLVFAADRSGRYLCAHLGDGCVLMQPPDAEASAFSIISSPSHGIVPHSTYLTMNADMMRHLKVYRSLRPSHGKFLLLTDGADNLLRNSSQESHLPCPFSGPALERYLDSQHPLDDYSAAVIMIP